MCGRYTLFTPPEDLEDRFGATFSEPFDPTYNAAPGQDLPVIRSESPGEFTRLSWGFCPEWADAPEDHPRPINARSETVADSGTFEAAYRRRRCLVPADGFYEWPDDADGPYRVALDDDEPFTMAGVYETWTGTRKQTALGEFGAGDTDRSRRLDSFAVLTTEPNDLVADLHHRMAVVVPPGERERWLTGTDPSDLLRPYPSGEMYAHPVSDRVNDPSNDDPELIVAE